MPARGKGLGLALISLSECVIYRSFVCFLNQLQLSTLSRREPVYQSLGQGQRIHTKMRSTAATPLPLVHPARGSPAAPCGTGRSSSCRCSQAGRRSLVMQHKHLRHAGGMREAWQVDFCILLAHTYCLCHPSPSPKSYGQRYC